MKSKKITTNLDWISVILYTILIIIGWVCIYATNYTEKTKWFDFSQFHTKQLIFIAISMGGIIIVMLTEVKFYQRFSSIFYLCCLVLLIGLFFFGKKINGARAWYGIGSITFQPSEFAKIATSLVFAQYLSSIQVDVKQWRYLCRSLLIIAIPILLIMLQPDPGSVLVYLSFVLVLNREGMPTQYLWFVFFLISIFILSLKIKIVPTLLVCLFVSFFYAYYSKKKTKRIPFKKLILFLSVSVIISCSTTFLYENVLKQHHRDRISIWLGLNNDITSSAELKRTVGYNSNQSESAIASGGLYGKGFLEGTRTKGGFVPEQHTDYIFTTLAEEWGFYGVVIVIIIFTALLLRIWYLSERQLNKFTRIYGYCVISILFTHFIVNIGMVIGLLPTVGIPLPFFSYGGSGLLGFTLLLFIFLKLDTSKGVRFE